jgi:hypothetical protein
MVIKSFLPTNRYHADADPIRMSHREDISYISTDGTYRKIENQAHLIILLVVVYMLHDLQFSGFGIKIFDWSTRSFLFSLFENFPKAQALAFATKFEEYSL